MRRWAMVSLPGLLLAAGIPAYAMECMRLDCDHMNCCAPAAHMKISPAAALAAARLRAESKAMGLPDCMTPSDVMQMPGMNHTARPGPGPFIDAILAHEAAGTDAEPASTPHPMVMAMRAGWHLMLHGAAFLSAIQQSGPRGGDKIFSTNWLMPMAQRELGPGQLTLRAMFSLEPATVTDRRYPELFQVGEVAYGNPVVDGQHPHNFFMELAALYDLRVGDHALLSFYAAPVGGPALGPEAYPHRASASEDPLAPLGHHLEDSTHISDEVFTAGFAYKIERIEVSGFHGREPDEFRWDIDAGRVDSWSTRATLAPGKNWSAQYSIGRLHSPEQLFPAEDTLRMTASVAYNRPLARGNWASLLLWGRNRTLPGGEVANGYLAESTLNFLDRNFVWMRIEDVDRTNLLALGENPIPPGFAETFFARVQAYTAGYDREFPLIPHVATALGGQFTLYGMPSSLNTIYGAHPAGVVFFVRLRPAP